MGAGARASIIISRTPFQNGIKSGRRRLTHPLIICRLPVDSGYFRIPQDIAIASDTEGLRFKCNWNDCCIQTCNKVQGGGREATAAAVSAEAKEANLQKKTEGIWMFESWANSCSIDCICSFTNHAVAALWRVRGDAAAGKFSACQVHGQTSRRAFRDRRPGELIAMALKLRLCSRRRMRMLWRFVCPDGRRQFETLVVGCGLEAGVIGVSQRRGYNTMPDVDESERVQHGSTVPHCGQLGCSIALSRLDQIGNENEFGDRSGMGSEQNRSEQMGAKLRSEPRMASR
ncbi:hypothetical protein EVAR_97098_1 [Eumeta japonica]|uniref:Uncharacterized protein n=1 Tax=Eumeta variegata TaxID=151549 RepID=A0A4C1X8W6_EUMVA|nr:hypothetical protein EVAR_97098_1 [Eumeta japonica]